MKPRHQGIPALELIEEAVHLLRRSPLPVLGSYYLGSMPFILALLYFWVDMSQGAFSENRAARGALQLAVLFVWMKSWQTVFAARIRALIRGEEAPRWSWGRVTRMVEAQAILQTSGLIALPVAILTMVPYVWVHAWYQNLTVLGDGTDRDLRKLSSRAFTQARLWPRQGILLVWLLSPALVVMVAAMFLVIVPVVEEITPGWTSGMLWAYAVFFFLLMIPLSPLGLIVALNVGAVISIVPYLLESLFGVENVVTLGGDVTNSTYYAICCAATYLIMDPVQKAAYALRCFYGESLNTGEDLKVALRQAAHSSAARTGLLLLAMAGACLCGAPAARAEEPCVSPMELNDAIDRVLEQREYAWRLDRFKGPRDETEKSKITLFMEAVMQEIVAWLRAIRDVFQRLTDWLNSLFPDRPERRPGAWSGWRVIPRWTMYGIVAVLACLLAVFLFRAWQRRGQPPIALVATPVMQTPDIEDEGVGADALPEDGWLTMARELMDRGEWRLAVRALFLAGLALLARHEMIRVAKYKSNHEYEREVARRAHAHPEILEVFSTNIALFERVWYGSHDAGPDLARRFDENQERMRSLAENP